MTMTDCAFCWIFRGELPSSRVLENELVVALLDIHPINTGHTLLIPRRHVCAFTELTALELQQLVLVGQRIASALKVSLTHCEGVSLLLADGAAAGQEVPHAHLHVIPRQQGDGFGWRLPPDYGPIADRAELEAIAARIRTALPVEIKAE